MKLIALSIFVVIFPIMAVSVPYFSDGKPVSKSEPLQLGIDAFYNAQWTDAQHHFSQIIEEERDHPHAHFFAAMIPFWQYFFGGNETKMATQFLEKSEKAIRITERALKKTPSDTSLVLMLSGLYGYRALVASSEKEYRIAMKSGMTGFAYTRQMLAMNTDNPNAMIGKGVFNYMTGSIPKGLGWLAKGIGISGSVEEGFKALEMAAQSQSYVRTDAQMILCHLYLKEGQFNDAYRMAKLLVTEYPENTIFQYHMGVAAASVGNQIEAEQAFALVAQSRNEVSPKLREEARLKLDEFLLKDSSESE